MALYTKQSLEQLRERVDLVDLVSANIDLKRAGSAYKACCPFHDERTPSFVIQRGDDHYHCYGCGAHGDAIQFMMSHLRLSFVDAVEALAQRYHVSLEREERGEREVAGPPKAKLKEVLEQACRFYHFSLLHTEEGHRALEYLYLRGLDLDFIRRFRVGWAPSEKVLHRYLDEERDPALLRATGLFAESRTGDLREFFNDRITFPLIDPTGAVVGFSARKIRDQTFGGKYINSPETPLFRKSRFLFGLNYCRKRIAKERRALIVEGQIDALRLIEAGFNFTVAGLGTAFGDNHVQELKHLGVHEVYLAFDSDEAGRDAMVKAGHYLQGAGIEVWVLSLPLGADPDTLLNERGVEGVLSLFEEKQEYLAFLVEQTSRKLCVETPAGKNELIQTLSGKIREWQDPVMVHESLRRLATLAKIPEDLLGIGIQSRHSVPMRESLVAKGIEILPDQVLEHDLLRWLLLMGEKEERFCQVAQERLPVERLRDPVCRQIYETYLKAYSSGEPRDLLSLAMQLDTEDGQTTLSEILKKRVNIDRAEEHFLQTVQRIVERNWLVSLEEIKARIQQGDGSDEEMMGLAKEYSRLQQAKPEAVAWPT